MFLARWLLNYDAAEWWDMAAVKRAAYERGMQRWLPHILYGADAVEAERKRGENAQRVTLSELPGGSISRAGM